MIEEAPEAYLQSRHVGCGSPEEREEGKEVETEGEREAEAEAVMTDQYVIRLGTLFEVYSTEAVAPNTSTVIP